MSEGNKSWYEISKSHLDNMKERSGNESTYSHYDSLINDHVLDVEVDKDDILANEDELDAIFAAEDSYDMESEEEVKKR